MRLAYGALDPTTAALAMERFVGGLKSDLCGGQLESNVGGWSFDDMKIYCCQFNIEWENKTANSPGPILYSRPRNPSPGRWCCCRQCRRIHTESGRDISGSSTSDPGSGFSAASKDRTLAKFAVLFSHSILN